MLSLIFQRECATARRAHAETREKISAHHVAVEDCRLIAKANGDSADAQRRESHEVGKNLPLVS